MDASWRPSTRFLGIVARQHWLIRRQGTIRPLNIEAVTFFNSVLKQDPKQQHAKKSHPCVDKSKAVAMLLSHGASDIVWRLYTTGNIGKYLNV